MIIYGQCYSLNFIFQGDILYQDRKLNTDGCNKKLLQHNKIHENECCGDLKKVELSIWFFKKFDEALIPSFPHAHLLVLLLYRDTKRRVRIKIVLFYQLYSANGWFFLFRLRGGLSNMLPQPVRVNLQVIQKCLPLLIGYGIKSLLKILREQQEVWFTEISALTTLCSIPQR